MDSQNNTSRIIPVNIKSEMEKSGIQYAMSVIMDRALPDVRDGLKPVHRRILYAMYEAGFTPDKPYRKSVATVGDVMKKYHPHGDAAIYDSMVRMAQDFSLRYTLIDGQGNFGSIDGDPAAAMRYTEARLTRLSMELVRDINKNTVDFVPNYDGQEMQPEVLPSRFPNLLVNGSMGIAVGMATNIPPHNLGEVIEGINMVIDNPDVTVDELMKAIKGPDFPTGGIILGKSGIRDTYREGKGRIIVRAKTDIEPMPNNRYKIVVTEIPYSVNKARLIEKIADLVHQKRIDGISDLRDESDREGMRIVIELKKDANPNVVLNQLFKHTQLQITFGAVMLVIVKGENGKFEPKQLNLKQLIEYYVDHQREVIVRRTRFDLEKAEARAHILEGLRMALDNLDEVISIIRASKNEPAAKENLIQRFGFSEQQAQAIVEMRLGRLTALEREKIDQEYEEKLQEIRYYKEVLSDSNLVNKIIKDELREIKTKFGDERRTAISSDESDIDIEDLIDEEESVITLTHFGYIKRIPSDTYKSQNRGGKGIAGLSTREEDFVEGLFVASTHHYILFFTNKGRVYRLKAYEIPESGRQAKGTAIVNLLQLEEDERVTAVIPIKDFSAGRYLLMATRYGFVKKTDLLEYENIRKGGLIAVNLRPDDELIDVKLTDGNSDIILVTKNGMAIRFRESDVRPLGRATQGVKGITLDEDDYVVSLESYTENNEGLNPDLLIVTENGFGKRTEMSEYRIQTRGGKGILTCRVTERTGKVVGAALVTDADDVMLMNSDGIIIRIRAVDISIVGRVTQGVTLMKLDDGVQVVCVERVPTENGNEKDSAENNYGDALSQMNDDEDVDDENTDNDDTDI